MSIRSYSSRGRYAVIPLLCLALVGGGALAWQAPPAARSWPVTGTLTTLPRGARVLGVLPASYPLRLIVGLRPRHQAMLDAFARLRAQVRGPARSGDELSPAQFADLFSPTPAAQAAVESYLRSFGLRVMRRYPDRLLLDVAGTAAQAEAAFGASLVRYRARGGRVFYANATPARLPASVAALVSTIVGLRDDAPPRHVPLPRLVGAHLKRSRVGPHARLDRSLQPPPASLLTPQQIKTAYNVTPIYSQTFTTTDGLSATAAITGAGQTIAVYELSPYSPTDVAAYDAAFNITAAPPLNIPVDGGATDPFGGLGAAEAAMDVELVQALAPGAQIIIYNGPASPTSTDNQGADDTYARIVNDNRVQVLSTSWGQCEPDQLADTPPDIALLHNLFAQAVAEGITIVAASGDSGANDCTDGRTNPSVDFPASDPAVIGVGGTVLSVDSAGKALSEVGWFGSGGGASTVYTRPSWQTGPGLPAGAMREVPDVALNAGTYYAVWVGGGWDHVNGTSAATPVWAALIALANQARGVVSALQGTPTPGAGTAVAGLGNILPQLYRLAGTSAFCDITAGADNGVATPGPGWDGVTGLGVPNAYVLLRALIGQPAATGAAGSCPVTAPTPRVTAPPLGTATPAPTGVASPTITATVPATGTATSGATRTAASGLAVRVAPRSVYAGGFVSMLLRGAPRSRQTVIFELTYPDRRWQRLSSLTDAHGAAAGRLRVLAVAPHTRPLEVRISATLRVGHAMMVRWTSFRILPTPVKRDNRHDLHAASPRVTARPARG